MTREPDDTSLGADLLGDVYGNDTIAQQTAAEPAISGAEGGALFETPSAMGDTGESSPAIAMVHAEAYDGAASGWVGGLALGAIIAVGVAAFTLIMGLTSTAGGGMVGTFGDKFMIIVSYIIVGLEAAAIIVSVLLLKGGMFTNPGDLALKSVVPMRF